MGGEKIAARRVIWMFLGSPPRGRGKGPSNMLQQTFDRITPAWAGKSGRTCRAGAARRDHPRVGGEKRNLEIAHIATKGSPPRGRGKENQLNP